MTSIDANIFVSISRLKNIQIVTNAWIVHKQLLMKTDVMTNRTDILTLQ